MARQTGSLSVNEAYLDTDVIVRFVTGDDPDKMAAASRLFSAVEKGEQALHCPVTAIADAVFVLSSPRLYAVDRQLVATALVALLDLPRLHVAQKPIARRALEVFARTNLDFGDAMLVAEMETTGVVTLFSCDRDFDRIPSIHRQEPP
jgi:predicted nucleic acid-binding protein